MMAMIVSPALATSSMSSIKFYAHTEIDSQDGILKMTVNILFSIHLDRFFDPKFLVKIKT
jgi:hypothetical protein